MSKSEMDLISFFLEKTGALGKDCFEYNDRIIFLVNKVDVGKVIGESGNKINSLRNNLRKNIDIIAYNSDFTEFLKNIFHPIQVLTVNLTKTKIEVVVKKENIGRAIGKQGRNLERVKFILNRHFDGVQNIKVISERSKNLNNELEDNN
ncbi:MAG: NusA-like transcription termination signal-binding factor [Candidatus Hodarchaeales archaeon]|jgi:NusA-like KH domain protein